MNNESQLYLYCSLVLKTPAIWLNSTQAIFRVALFLQRHKFLSIAVFDVTQQIVRIKAKIDLCHSN